MEILSTTLIFTAGVLLFTLFDLWLIMKVFEKSADVGKFLEEYYSWKSDRKAKQVNKYK